MKNIAIGHISIKIGKALALVGLPVISFAQEQLPLTLERAKALATENNPEIAAGRLDESINGEAVAAARLNRLPQVYADFNMQRNIIIPVTPVPANAFDPTAPEGKLQPLRFTTKWTANTGINASYDLFNPQQKLAVAEAEIKGKITKLENESRTHDILFEVSKAYVEALIAAEQLRLSVADTQTKTTRLQLSQQQFDEGRMTLATLNSIKADRNNTLNTFEEAQKIYVNSKAQLLYTLGYAPDAAMEIQFVDSLEGLFAAYQRSFGIDSLNSIALNKLKLNEDLLSNQITAAQKSNLPSLVLKGYYGANYFDNSFEILKSANWNGNSFVNIGLRLPLSERFARQREIRQLELQKEANRLRYTYERNKNRLDYDAAVRDAAMYAKNYARARENFLLAEKNLQLAEQQFAGGRLLLNELNSVAYDYEKEKNNYLNLAYNYILSMLNVEKLIKL